MGYHISRPKDMFCDVVYNIKTTSEIRHAMTKKVTEIKENIRAREERIQKIRGEYSIGAERLAILVMRFKENQNNVTSYEQQEGPIVPAGVIANLIQERSMIDSEVGQIRKLELVLRNIRDEEFYENPTTGELGVRQTLHELDDEELEYLGF